MEALWVIIFIVFVLIRVFNKIPDLKGKLPEDWEKTGLPPVLKEMGFPWDFEDAQAEPQGGQPPVQKHGKNAKNKGKGREKFMDQKTGIIPKDTTRDVKGDINPVEGEISDSGFMGDNIHGQPIVLDAPGLINGIILSELLQPPKSRRHR